jgi:hypothetical protein
MAFEDLGVSPPEKPKEEEKESESPILDTPDETEKEGEAEEAADEETEEKPEGEAEEEKEDEDHADGLVPKEVVQKRIDKLVAKRKEAEEKAAAVVKENEELKTTRQELEAKLNEAARPVLSPTPENPLADISSESELEQRITSAHAVRRWALQNSDGATVKGEDGQEKFIDASEVKDFLIKADDLLTIHAPAKREWLKEHQSWKAPVEQNYPDLFKAGSEANKAYTTYLQKRPNFAREPDRDYVYAMALLGEQKWREMQEAAEAKDKAQKKISSEKVATSKAPTPAKPVSSKSVTKGGNAAKRVDVTGLSSRSDLETLIAEQLLS